MPISTFKRKGEIILNIKNILENIDYKLIKGTVDLDIEKIEHDSRKVKKGDIFLAMRGFSVDGHKFIGKAIENGAIAIIITEDIDVDFDITVIQLKNDMDIIAKMISNYYENPSYKLNMIGITGTNGKTSITYMLKNIFEASSKKIGLVGTMGSLINNQLVGNKNTTPDNLELQRQLNEMVKVDTEYCFMEVSSHSLDMKRVSGLNFDIGVFINLTEDHLDYHGTMDSYFESKKKLFYRTERANLINIDDYYGKKLIDELKSKSKVEIISYGLDCKADIFAKNISFSNRGLSYTLKSQDGEIDIEMKLLGEFNIYNSLAAASVALSYGFTLEEIKKGLESIEGIKGRFELLETETDYSVIIDFAHTPDGLKQVLKSVRDFSKEIFIAYLALVVIEISLSDL